MEKIERDKRIPILVSEEEKRLLETAAAQDALPVSSWLRLVGLREARKNGD